jgi:YidC/Oxa1 family membrane protein insertase
MDTRRLILFVIFSFSILMLWDKWQQKNHPIPVAETQTNAGANVSAAEPTKAENSAVSDSFKLERGQRILVSTDLFLAEIDTIGGDLRHLELKQHRDTNVKADAKNANYVLMDDTQTPMLYVTQSGFLGADLPNHKSTYTSTATSYQLADGAASQEIRLSWANNGITVDKIYTFKRGSYLIDVSYQINNGGTTAITPSSYYQIVHDDQSKQGSKMMPTFTGGAYFTDADRYKKIKFKDMQDNNLSKTGKDGWIGLVEHYFVGSWIAKKEANRELYTKKLTDNLFALGVVIPASSLPAGAKIDVGAQLYAGPQTQKDLSAAAPGMEFTVDYGWLTIIAKPLFWVLSKLHSVLGNWGVAIIFLTFLLKLMFYPLSAKSYRSMAQMRELAPRLQAMKEKFGDDKQKMQQAMMELYKTEKINPLGGCLPILVQIPVFISFYWMLLATVELRNAPFFGWIKDLSAPDTLFGTLPSAIPLIGGMPIGLLPILMGATMIIQTYLNPPPTDPVQAQVMKIMPIVFSIFFFFFPAGLVLYWLVNNILSIAQQWYVNKTIHAAAMAKTGNAK